MLPAKPSMYLTLGKIEMHILPAVYPQGKTSEILKKEVYDIMANYYLANNKD